MRSVDESEAFLRECFIFPFLHQVWKRHRKLKLWSHQPLVCDRELYGEPDYLVSAVIESVTDKLIDKPFLAVAEAKREDFTKGWAQCLAEMIACQKINDDEQAVIYGIVPTGSSGSLASWNGTRSPNISFRTPLVPRTKSMAFWISSLPSVNDRSLETIHLKFFDGASFRGKPWLLRKNKLTAFASGGYAVVPNMFTRREVRAMRGELDRFKRDGLLRNVATDGDGQTHSQTQSTCRFAPSRPRARFIAPCTFTPKVIALVEQLIGSPFVVLPRSDLSQTRQTGALARTGIRTTPISK